MTAEPARIEFRVVELMNRLLDVTPENLDAEIDSVLAALGQAGDFARSFVFRYDEASGYSNTHEWVRPGVRALKPAMQRRAGALLPSWHEKFMAGQTVMVADVDALPQGSAERSFLERIGIRSSLMVPLMDGARLFGLIGFDSVCPNQAWPQDIVFLLTSIGRAVSSVLLRIEAATAEAAARSHLGATLHALPDLVIELSASGEIVACHSDKLPWLADLVRAGIGRPLGEILPEPLAGVLGELVATPPAGPCRRHPPRGPFDPGCPAPL